MDTIERWLAAERFYTFLLPVFVVIFLFFLIVTVFVITYAGKGTIGRKRYFQVLGLIVCIGGLYSIWGHRTYQSYLTQNEHINPAMRSYDPIFGLQIETEQTIIDSYQQTLHQSEEYRALDMYIEEEVTEPFPYEYIGSTDRDHYFVFREDRNLWTRFTGELRMTAGESYLLGSHFHLIDDAFKEYGFMDTPYPIVEALYLNEEQYNQGADDFDIPYRGIHHISLVFPEWNLGRQRVGGTNLHTN